MPLFGRSKSKSSIPTTPQDPLWIRNERGAFHRLLELETDSMGLSGVGGVYVVWHGGVRPEWVYIGESTSLARAITNAQDNNEIAGYDINGHLFVTWAPIVEGLRKGAVLDLTQRMRPVVANPMAPSEATADIQPVPLIFPGIKAK
jgi:hypothetical protein